MVTGDINHTNRLKQKFLELNGYADPVESSHKFNEVYQAAYSLRVILRFISVLFSPLTFFFSQQYSWLHCGGWSERCQSSL
jgi:hypothetical protein